jgi:hypothetical protein
MIMTYRTVEKSAILPRLLKTVREAVRNRPVAEAAISAGYRETAL